MTREHLSQQNNLARVAAACTVLLPEPRHASVEQRTLHWSRQLYGACSIGSDGVGDTHHHFGITRHGQRAKQQLG